MSSECKASPTLIELLIFLVMFSLAILGEHIKETNQQLVEIKTLIASATVQLKAEKTQ